MNFALFLYIAIVCITECEPFPTNELHSEVRDNGNKADPPRLAGCVAPEVLINGSPSSSDSMGGGFANIEEIQFFATFGPENEKQICTIKCLNRKWVGPLCAPQRDIECPPIESQGDEKRVMSIEGTQKGNKRMFSCITGYLLEGPDEIVCNSNGFWSHPPPKCRAIHCLGVQTSDPHIRVSYRTRTYGSRAYFSCPNGYQLNGPSYVTCLKNNSWSDDLPTCGPLSVFSGQVSGGEDGCPHPGETVDGHIVPTKHRYEVGEMITVVCKHTYRLSQPFSAECGPNGFWSASLPRCVRSLRPTKKPIKVRKGGRTVAAG